MTCPPHLRSNGKPRMSDNPVRINSREELIYLLSEAAEVEHGVMCNGPVRSQTTRLCRPAI